MEEHLRRRLAELESELESGLVTLRDLEEQETLVRKSLLRISGAIDLAKECLAAPAGESTAAPVPGHASIDGSAQPIADAIP